MKSLCPQNDSEAEQHFLKEQKKVQTCFQMTKEIQKLSGIIPGFRSQRSQNDLTKHCFHSFSASILLWSPRKVFWTKKTQHDLFNFVWVEELMWLVQYIKSPDGLDSNPGRSQTTEVFLKNLFFCWYLKCARHCLCLKTPQNFLCASTELQSCIWITVKKNNKKKKTK